MATEDKTIRREITNLVQKTKDQFLPHLIYIAGDEIGKTYRITKPKTTVGRTDECDIPISDEQVSRKHACLILADQSVTIEDLGSTNGTLVNGLKIDKIRLKNNDRIQIGSLTMFKFYCEEGVEQQFIENLYRSATKDFLTSAFNRKYFLDRAESDFYYAIRHNTPLSLVMVDIDDFKKVNDTHTHLAGDMVLKNLSQITQNFIRKEDLFARLGGEEFAILLRDTPSSTALKFADNLRKKIETSLFVFENQEFKLTISLGITTLKDKNHDSLQSLIYSADTALYQAKRSGKNKVVFSKLDEQ